MMQSVESPYENKVILIKKLRKDGSADSEIIHNIAQMLKQNGVVVLPVDSHYELVGIDNPTVEEKLKAIIKSRTKRFVRLISSFKMLEQQAVVSKLQYDFLHRIWPGEVTVIVPRREDINKEIALRYPKTKFIHDIIESVESPLLSTNIQKYVKDLTLNEIKKTFGKKVNAIVIIEEISKRHPRPTIISLMNGKLRLIRSGKVSFEEIQSYYFLGSCDDEIY